MILNWEAGERDGRSCAGERGGRGREQMTRWIAATWRIRWSEANRGFWSSSAVLTPRERKAKCGRARAIGEPSGSVFGLHTSAAMTTWSAPASFWRPQRLRRRLTFFLSLCLPVCLSIYPSIYLSVCLSIYQSICRFVCLAVCLSSKRRLWLFAAR